MTFEELVVSEFRALQGELGSIRETMAKLELGAAIAKEDRSDVKVLVMALGKSVVQIESKLGESLSDLHRAKQHIETHCIELDNMKLANAGAKGMLRGAAIVGGGIATLLGSAVAGLWGMAQHFGWFGLGGK